MTGEEQQEQPRLSRLEQLLRKAEQIQARIELEKTRQRARDRKSDNRRKILYGVAVLAAERSDLIDKKLLHDLLDQFITADRDRQFLGLDVRSEDQQEQQPDQEPPPPPPSQPKPGSFEVHPDTPDEEL
jgi:hypothetical protein